MIEIYLCISLLLIIISFTCLKGKFGVGLIPSVFASFAISGIITSIISLCVYFPEVKKVNSVSNLKVSKISGDTLFFKDINPIPIKNFKYCYCSEKTPTTYIKYHKEETFISSAGYFIFDDFISVRNKVIIDTVIFSKKDYDRLPKDFKKKRN